MLKIYNNLKKIQIIIKSNNKIFNNIVICKLFLKFGCPKFKFLYQGRNPRVMI